MWRPVWEFQRHELGGVRLLVEKVSERTVKGGGGFHPVELTISGTALDYQGGVGDVYRAGLAYRPPAPRPGTGVAADPNQVIIRPTDVAISVSLPIRLGGSLSAPTSTAAWTVPDGAILTRVSGHQIGVPLSLSFMARCLPRGVLGPGQGVEVRLWGRDVGCGHRVCRVREHDGPGRLKGRAQGGSGSRCGNSTLFIRCAALAGLRAGSCGGLRYTWTCEGRMRRLILTAGIVALAGLVSAQVIAPVVDSLDVDSTAADAVDVAGGIVLGIDLLPDHGGVPEADGDLLQRDDMPVSARVVSTHDPRDWHTDRVPLFSGRERATRERDSWHSEVAMRAIIKGVILGAVVAAGVSVLLAQAPWTAPRTWATDDLLTAGQFNQQFRDNLLWLRADATLTGTAALDDLGCGTRGSGEVLYSDCDWAALPAGVVSTSTMTSRSRRRLSMRTGFRSRTSL